MDEGTIKIENELTYMLEIERGRHVKPQKISLEQRICLLAESKLHNTEFDSLSNSDTFIYIMSSTDRR